MPRLEDFAHHLSARELIATNLQAFGDQRLPAAGQREAAVVLAITRCGAEASVVLTRRAGSLRAHGNQWALPGGRLDPGETAVQAALRELHEEINLEVEASQVLGVLDDYGTRSGYNITPVVVWTDVEWQSLEPNPEEVALIEPFSFSELARSDSPILQDHGHGGHPVLSMHFNQDVVFAPTGAILYQFREVALMGRDTRVAHYDQPAFAWR